MAMGISLLVGLVHSVWFDEAYSIMLAKRPVGDLLYLTGIDTHPPFYYLLLKVWASIFGWSEVALRSLSVLAMGGAALIGILLVKRVFGVRTAMMTLPFVILAPFLLRYGFEIRMYALASLIGIAATYTLIIALESRGRRQWLFYICYAALVALGVFTLYYTVLLWITHVIWLIWRTVREGKPVLKQKWWLAYVGSIVLFLPWLPTFLKQIGNGALAPISQQMTTENMIGIVSFWFLYQPAWQLNGISSLVIVAIITTIVYIVVQAFRNVSVMQKQFYILFAFYAGMPVGLIALISLFRPMYVERYLAHVLIGFGLFLGVSVWLAFQKQPQRVRLLALSLIAVSFYGAVHVAASGNYNFQRLQLPQTREVAEFIGCSKDRPILAADPYVAIELSYYITHCDIYFYSDTAELKGGYAPLAYSSLRVANPAEKFKETNKLTYVYYDKSQLSLPSRLQANKDITFGPLHVQTLSVE